MSFSNSGERGGALGFGTFDYRCLDAGDDFCASSPDRNFPERIALGASFGLELAFDDDAFLDEREPLQIEAIDEHRLYAETDENEGGDAQVRWRTRAPGWAVAVARTQGEVYDLVHLRVTEVDQLKVRTRIVGEGGRERTVDELELVVGQAVKVRARPVDQNGGSLAGVLPVTWELGDTEIATMQNADSSMFVTLEGLSVGESLLSIHTGEFARDLPLRVVLGADEETDG